MAKKFRSSISSHPIQFCVISTVAIDTDEQYDDFFKSRAFIFRLLTFINTLHERERLKDTNYLKKKKEGRKKLLGHMIIITSLKPLLQKASVKKSLFKLECMPTKNLRHFFSKAKCQNRLWPPY